MMTNTHHKKMMKFAKRGNILIKRSKKTKRHLHVRKLPVNAFYGIKLNKRKAMRKGMSLFKPLLKINKYIL